MPHGVGFLRPAVREKERELNATTLPADPLRRARDLADMGSFTEAIEELTRANRERPDPELEAELVQLRHAACASLPAVDPARPWPPDQPDPFPDVVGDVPEIDRAALTAPVLGGALQHHGSLLVRGLVDPATATELREAIDAAFDAFDAADGDTPAVPTPWFQPFKPGGRGHPATDLARVVVRSHGGVLAADSPRSLFLLTEALAPTAAVIAEHLGERPALSSDKCVLRKCPPDAGTDWHQDGAFLGQGIRTVDVWLSLSDCGGDTDCPGVDVVPCRLDGIVATGTDDAQFEWSVGNGERLRASEGMPAVRPRFAPGDALLFDDILLHRTGTSPSPNTTSVGAGEGTMRRTRWAIEAWFFAPSCYPGDRVPILF